MSPSFPNKTIHQLFEEQVEKSPEKIALRFEEQQLTYRELNVRANQLAHYLTAHHDIRPDKLIGMSFERGMECIVSMLAILKAGAAYVPLDPGYPKERLQFMLQDINTDIILTREDLAPHLPATGNNIVLADRDLYNDFPTSNLRSSAEPHHLAYVLYTSGTTGRPKGVMVEHRNVVQLVKDQTYFDISSQDVMAQSFDISFDIATCDIFGALLNGITLSVLSRETTLSSQLFKAAIQKSSITVCSVTSALFDRLVLQDATLFSGLNYLFVGGDVLNGTAVEKILAEKGQRPRVILNGYGPTETTAWATSYQIPDDFKAEQHPMPIGLPLRHTQTYILDDNLQPVPKGTVGELVIGGAGVARGYLNLPEATQQKFIANPFATADDKKNGSNLRMYRSGDLARYSADGNIEFMGRRDQQVKIRGFRIECGEVEHALLSHDQIAQAAVRAVEHCGEKQLVAYYVPKINTSESACRTTALQKYGSQGSLNGHDLKKYLHTRLPEYMIPQHFIPLVALPLTANNKLDVRALPVPQASVESRSTPYVAPASQLEVQLAALWSEVLEQKNIGIHDDFFELGGSSLVAIQLVSTINQKLNVEVSVPDLFYLKNIEALAKYIALSDSGNLQERQRPCEINKDDATESETLILRDYFLSEFKLVYNESFVIEPDRPVTFGEFHGAVDMIFSECELLHANYFCEEGRYSRKINKNSPVVCEYADISHSVDSDVEFSDRINTLVRNEFNISQDKLIRFYLFKLSEGRRKIFVVFFHALLDGTSVHLLCQNFFQLIGMGGGDPVTTLRHGEKDDFYLLGSQIREHYEKGKRPEGEPKDDKIAYWRDFFNRFEYCPVSPTPDFSKSRLGNQVAFVIENDVKENLLALSKQLHISLFDVLFGCFMLLLNKFTQQNSIAVRTSIDERLYGPQYTQTLGCFVNNLFLGVEIDADATLLDLLIASKKDKDQAIRNGLSYDTLVENFREQIIDLSRIHFNLERRESHDHDFYTSQIQAHSGQVKNDLFIELDVKKNKISGRVEYKSASFDQYFIESLIQCYANILKRVDLFIKPTIQGLLSLIDQRSASASLQAHDMRSAIDFDAEAILPDDIYPEDAEFSHMENPQNIFLTGANGFLGGYLLEELLNKTTATIYCLVRAVSSVEAERKLLTSLKDKCISVELAKHRIVVLPGDLAQPRFALPEETFALLTKKIDVIYHNGAAVNFLYPYEFLKATNVDSVKEVLRLAKTTRLKPVHYISTLGVFCSLHLKRSITVINEDQPVDFGDQLFMGYPETKWVAEKLLGEAKKRGFPVCIYRFMEVTGHSKTGYSNTKSLEMAYLKGCIEMGLIWDLPMKKYYEPVDYLAQAIVYLSRQAASTGQNFHVQNTNPISQIELAEILNDLGYPVEFAPYDTWVQKIMQDCWRRLNIDPPCRLNIDPGRVAVL